MRNAPGRGKVIRPIGFEKHLADIGFHRVASETVAQRNQREAEEVLRSTEAAAEERRKEKVAQREAKALERLSDGQKAWSDKKGVFFEGFDRVMEIDFNTPGYHWALKRTEITNRELRMLINRPDAFPNPRLVYSYLHNTYRIVWDGMEN